MSEWYVVLLLAVGGVCFLVGRWRGIRDYEKALKEVNFLQGDDDD